MAAENDRAVLSPDAGVHPGAVRSRPEPYPQVWICGQPDSRADAVGGIGENEPDAAAQDYGTRVVGNEGQPR
jgi:hypothetical protein